MLFYVLICLYVYVYIYIYMFMYHRDMKCMIIH